MRHTSRLLAALLLSACVLALPACDSDDGDDTPSINGDWVGTVNAQGIAIDFDATFVESNDDVSGTGTVSINISGGPSDSFSFDVDGTYDYPDVDLTLTAEDEPASYEGEMSEGGEVIRGTFRGAAMSYDLTLTRDE